MFKTRVPLNSLRLGNVRVATYGRREGASPVYKRLMNLLGQRFLMG